MPQSGRKDSTSQRAQDKESKRARGALSCAECRRLKLKCDKTVPCSSCKRRGCSSICPNGALITGQGTRFVLADTEKLHQKIAIMSDRIRQLEDALSILQSTVTNEPHPLLDRDMLKIKSSIELHAAIQDAEASPVVHEEDVDEYIDAFGTLAIRDDGGATFYGRSAGSESLLIGESSTPEDVQMTPPTWGMQSPMLTQLTAAFPFTNVPADVDLDYLVEHHLPDWDEAYRLCSLYLDTAPWFFGAVTQRQLFEELLPLWYDNNAKKHVTPSTHLHSRATPSTNAKACPHDLALFFIILCFGALTDMSLPPAPDNATCDKYSNLTKAALSLEPLLERPPSVATVQTLALMAIYEGLKSGENSIEATWTLMGIATKLAQSVGLHRDCARWQLSPAEVQKRRALFWELFITDGWQSLATGRLATFSLPFVDCELPYDPDQTLAEDGTPQPSFPCWKARFGAECVAAVVQGTLTSRAPKYSIILELDRKVRDMELPKYAQGSPPDGAGLKETMSHFMPTNYRELTLLYIHRCFFVHAITSNPSDPIKSQYAPSFLAGYRSACDLLASVREQFNRFPAQIARFWVLWTHAFSSVVMIYSVVTHGSQCKVAPAALLELKTACTLFESAATYGGRAVKFLPIVQRLQVKAQKVYFDTRNGIPPALPRDIFRPSSSEDNDDEMHIFSGKTHVLTTKNPPKTPSVRAPQNSTVGSRAPSDSPPQFFTDNPSFNGVHPSLVHELNGFDTHIRAQIENAYNADTVGFTQTLMGTHKSTSGPPPPRYSPPNNPHMQRQRGYEHYEAEQRRIQEDQYQLRLQEEQMRVAEHQRLADLQRAEELREAENQRLEEQKRLEQQHLEQQRLELEQQQRQEQLRHAEQQAQAQRPPQPLHYQYVDRPHVNQHAYPVSMNGEYGVHPSEVPRGVAIPAPPSSEPHPHSMHHKPSRPNFHDPYQHQHQRQHYNQVPPLRPPAPPPPHQPPPSSHSQPHTPQEIYQVSSDRYTKSRTYAPPDAISPTTSTSSTSSYYWPDHPTATAIPDAPGPQQYGIHAMRTSVPQRQHYTPDGAMRGIAAEDQGLQETWQSYMYNVGSPRHMFED